MTGLVPRRVRATSCLSCCIRGGYYEHEHDNVIVWNGLLIGLGLGLGVCYNDNDIVITVCNVQVAESKVRARTAKECNAGVCKALQTIHYTN